MNKKTFITMILALVAMAGQGQIKCHIEGTLDTIVAGKRYLGMFKQYNDSRRVGIDVSWKFNATRSRYKGSHAGQSERNRL